MVSTAEQTRSSITISATPAAVMTAIADVEAYPQWAGEVTRAEVLDRDTDGRPGRVRLQIDAAAVRDEQILTYRWDNDRTVSWSLESPTRMLHRLDGSYTLTATTAGATLVTYRLTVAVKAPLLDVLRRQAERVILERALAGLARRVDAADS